jgi:hypothetical protein
MTVAIDAPRLKAPFPWFGGKSTVAAEVWRRFGDTANFIDPFFGSGSILLGRPASHHWPRVETVNDLDGHLCNAWRAIQYAPDEVAAYADWPPSELDLHSRGDWLYYRPDAREWVERLRSDPDYYDAKSAGWWVWFASSWIGGLPAVPQDGQYGQGGGPDGVYERLPHLGDAGKGVARQKPHLGSGGQGNGVHSSPGEMPRREMLTLYMRQLAARLERVRVCCGDWTRVLGPSVTFKHGLTAVFFDPPYSHTERDKQLYSHDNDIAADVRQWALENGDNPLLRIALCGYTGEGHEELESHGWQPYYWKTSGGYGSQGKGETRGKVNSGREVIFFSPHCLNPIDTLPLFARANGVHHE